MVIAAVCLVVLLVAVVAWLVSHAVVLPKWRLGRHLRQIDQYGFQNEPGEFEEEPEAPNTEARGVFGPVFEALGRGSSRLIPRLPQLERADLSAAGLYGVSPDAIHGVRAFAAVLLPILVLLIYASFSVMGILILALSVVVGWEVPMLIIRQRGRARLNAIDRDLPRLIDVLIATIESGMGFAQSLQLVSTSFRGPLGAELALMRREQALGSSTEQALAQMANRADTPSVRAFSRSLLHGQELGISIGPMLRNLAVDIRRRRRQVAREKVQKAPVKMLFPLAILIFPPLLIVILYPALYSIIHSLSNT